MSKEFIASNVWHDPEGSCSIMLDVTDEVVPVEPQVVSGIELLPKSEYHVTLVAPLKQGLVAVQYPDAVIVVKDFLASEPEAIKFNGLSNERYLCQKDDEYSLIAPAEILGVEALYKVLSQRFDGLGEPFLHVTLLKSRNSEYGISVSSAEVLADRCQLISI